MLRYIRALYSGDVLDIDLDLDALDAKVPAERDTAVATLREIASGLKRLPADRVPEALTLLLPALSDLRGRAITASASRRAR